MAGTSRKTPLPRSLNFTVERSRLAVLTSHHWRFDMLVRSRDLADRMSGTQQPQIVTLPIESARLKDHEILDQNARAGFVTIVENWGSFPMVRLSSRCEICRLQAEHPRRPEAPKRPQYLARSDGRPPGGSQPCLNFGINWLGGPCRPLAEHRRFGCGCWLIRPEHYLATIA